MINKFVPEIYIFYDSHTEDELIEILYNAIKIFPIGFMRTIWQMDILKAQQLSLLLAKNTESDILVYFCTFTIANRPIL